MASPQLENGHTRIANEVIESICQARLSGNEISVLLYALRQTYGWGGRKKTDPFMPSSIGEKINMSKSSVHLAIQVLIERGIVSRDDQGRLSFLKDHEKWSGPVQPTERKRRKHVQPTEQTVQPTEQTVQPTEQTVQPTEPYKEKEKKEKKERNCEVRTLTPQQKLIRYFKEAKGVNADDKDWDRRHFCGRLVKEATEYLKAFDGNVKIAGEYLLVVGEEWKDLPDWSMPGAKAKAGRDPRLNGTEGEHGHEHGALDADRLDGKRRTGGLASARAIAGDTLRAIEATAFRAKESPVVAGPSEDSFIDGEDVF